MASSCFELFSDACAGESTVGEDAVCGCCSLVLGSKGVAFLGLYGLGCVGFFAVAGGNGFFGDVGAAFGSVQPGDGEGVSFGGGAGDSTCFLGGLVDVSVGCFA